MCGIAGGWFLKERPQLENKIQLALHAMRLRGPDDEGYSFTESSGGLILFGHKRLSIIDLSSGGHQPMNSICGQYTLVFNGEIYNYLELKEELVKKGVVFRSHSDTEVLLAAWIHWGESCLSRLIGMFAFAVFDQKNQTLTCVRDAFGIKPMFFTQEVGGFVFGSELAAIKALKFENCQLDWQRSYDYLLHGSYDNGERTFISNVNHLLPGHMIVFDARLRSLGNQIRWWSPKITEVSLSFNSAAECLREKFLSNIKLHLRSDVPVGAALSGGLDSSSVVCAMRYLEPQIRINTFSYIAKGSALSEEGWVDQINKYADSVAHKVFVSADEMIKDLDDMVLAQGEPFSGTSIYAQYRVFKAARESGVLVTLDGQGADELLAGYSGYSGQRLHSLLDQNRVSDAYDFLLHWSRWPNRSLLGGVKRAIGELTNNSSMYSLLRQFNGDNLVSPWINKNILIDGGISVEFSQKNQSEEGHGRRVMEALRVALTSHGLPSLLRHADRNSMRFSVESRVPFLTIEMAEFLLSLPENYLISNKGETKHIFRAAMRGIVPENVLNRKDKIGFETPEADWIGSLLPTMRKWLVCDLKIPFLMHHEMLKSFDAVAANPRLYSTKIWRLINFYRWHSHFFNQK
jgi:asparagine synthase (glutamine-hydrolysing)